MDIKAAAQKQITTITIIWFSLFSSQFIYLAVAHVIKPASTNDESNRIMLFMMGLMALTSVAAGLFFYRLAMKGYVKAGQLVKRERGRDRMAEAEHSNDNNTSTSSEGFPELTKPFAPYIISLAMIESVSVFGLLVAITTGEAKLSYVFFGVSIVLMIAVSPFIKIKPLLNNSINRLNKSY